MGAPAELFLLVEEFLKEQGCVNSLKAFQKEAKNTLKSTTKPRRTLIELYNTPTASSSSSTKDIQDKDINAARKGEGRESSSNASSAGESSSDSSSDEESSSSSSSSSSEDSESDNDADSVSSDTESSSDDEESSTSSSGSEDSSDDDSNNDTKKGTSKTSNTSGRKTSDKDIDSSSSEPESESSDSSSSSSSSSSDSDSDSDSSSSSNSDTKSEDKEFVVTKPAANAVAEPPAKKQKIEGTVSKTQNEPFKRVRAENVVFANEQLKDNTYMSKGGAENGYGYKAHLDMIVTRGKGFRAEKTKKKRGSYKGGFITNESHSFKFPDSD